MNCKDCLHYDACMEYTNLSESEYAQNYDRQETACEIFKDKSEWVHLPCNVGDTIYYPWIFDGIEGIAFSNVKEISIYDNLTFLVFVEDWGSDMPMPTAFYKENFGKTVFLTREEAEKALEERRKEDENGRAIM